MQPHLVPSLSLKRANRSKLQLYREESIVCVTYSSLTAATTYNSSVGDKSLGGETIWALRRSLDRTQSQCDQIGGVLQLAGNM